MGACQTTTDDMKTVNEWLQELPEPYRTQALENMGMSQSPIKVICMREALFLAFDSRHTPQGEEYWRNVDIKLINNEPLTPMTETTNGHPHAKLAQEYWKEAETNAEAYKNWEYQDYYGAWCCCHASPEFRLGTQYRRRPRTITINGYEVPEPLRTANDGQKVYMVCFEDPESFGSFCYDNSDYDRRLITRGVCHSAKEAAIAHAKALLSFTQGGGET